MSNDNEKPELRSLQPIPPIHRGLQPIPPLALVIETGPDEQAGLQPIVMPGVPTSGVDTTPEPTPPKPSE
jgi:hypothetical protein